MQKYLMDSESKAIRKGEFITADENAGEWIWLDDNSSPILTKAQLEDIASSNGFSLDVPAKAKVAIFASAVCAGLTELDIGVQNIMTNTQIAEQVIEEGISASLNDNEIMIQLLQKGIGYKEAEKLLKQCMQKMGYRISAKDRKIQGTEILNNIKFNPDTFNDIQEAVNTLTEKLADTSEVQALSVIRKYAKDNGLSLPRAPRSGRQPRGFRKKVFDYMVQNPFGTREDLIKLCEDEGKNTMIAKQFGQMFQVAQQMAEKILEENKQEKAA